MNRPVRKSSALLGWMSTLADETRLRLLRVLERNELGVVDLCHVLQLPQSTVSRHLKVLADQRWTGNRRQATSHLYHVALDELEPAARKLWLLAREQTENWPAVQQDQLRLARLLRDRQNESQAFFAGAAADWDKLRNEWFGDQFTTTAMLSLLPRGLIIADLGCGTGRVTAALASHVQRVIAVDNSPAMLKAARKRTEEHSNVDLRRGELEALPLEDASADAALLLLVLGYVPEPDRVLHEAARALKPGGRLVIVDLLPHDREDFRRQSGQQRRGFDPKDLQALVQSSGFSGCRIEPVAPEPGAKGPALFIAVCER